MTLPKTTRKQIDKDQTETSEGLRQISRRRLDVAINYSLVDARSASDQIAIKLKAGGNN